MKEMTIKDIAALLQKRIDIRLKTFKEGCDSVKDKYLEIEQLEKDMSEIVFELEPVQSLIYNQNPGYEKVFESLKQLYRKDENEEGKATVDRETNE